MNENYYKITDEELERVLLSSAAALPDSPSERGIRAMGIKRTFSEPLRLLTGYINAKLSALKGGTAPSAGDCLDCMPYGENINGIKLWLDGLYPTESENELINLTDPSVGVKFQDGEIRGNTLYSEKGAVAPIKNGDSSLTLTVSAGANTYPVCLFTLFESPSSYMSVYKKSATLCGISYRSSILSSEESYDFTVREGELTHITAVKRDDRITVYADGGLITVIEIPLFEPKSIYIGRDKSATPSPVFIRSLRLFERALTPAEVSTEHGSYKSREDAVSRDMSPIFDLPLSLGAPIRELFEKAVRDIRVEMNNDTFTLSFMPLDGDGNGLLSTPHTVDLPLEEMIVGGEYVDTSSHPASLMLRLKSGSSIYIPVGNLVKGLTHEADFLALKTRVDAVEGKAEGTEDSAFFGATYNEDEMQISFYPKDSTSHVSRVALADVAREPYKIDTSCATYCKDVAEFDHRVRVIPKRINKIINASGINNITGNVNSTTNEMYYGALGDAYFRFNCADMEDKELYTLSFSSNNFEGSFSIGVYNRNHIEITKNARNSISFIYDAKHDDGTILVDDGIRSAVGVLLYDFTLSKGGGDTYYPVLDYRQSVSIRTCGKNLLDFPALTTATVENGASSSSNNTITLTSSGSNCYTNAGHNGLKIPVKSGETLTFSWKTNSTSTQGTVSILGNNSSEYMQSCSSNVGKLVYTVPAGVTFITFRIGVEGSGRSLTYSDLQIERGSTPTEYTPYVKGESASVSINSEGFITPISPYMTVFTDTSGAMCQTEFIREGAASRAIYRMISDVQSEIDSFMESTDARISAIEGGANGADGASEAYARSPISLTASYSDSENKIYITLDRQDRAPLTADMTDAVAAFVAKEFFGGN